MKLKPGVKLSDIEDKLIEILGRVIYENKSTKNSKLECVIVYNGKRICLNGKTVWDSKGSANRAISYHIKNLTKHQNIWYNFCERDNNNFPVRFQYDITQDYQDFAQEVCKKFADNLTIVPLRDYMYNEYMAKEKK